MKIRLISTDRPLYQLCRETLARFPERDWDFDAADPLHQPEDADLCLWDFHPDFAIPESLDFAEERKNIFLVQREHLGAFRDRLPLAAVGILLKPVNQTALQTFLEHAVARYEAHRAAKRAGNGNAALNDRDEMLQCLLQANLKLQEYDQDRTNFLARALHDFRTPLTAVSGYCGLLTSQHLGGLNSGQVEVLQRMQHSIKRLSRMATAMFQLSVARRVKKIPDLQPGDIEDCIDHALHEIMPSAGDKDIAISVQLHDPPRPLWFEPAQVEQVLVNLLDNACKFTPKHGSIEIRGYPTFWDRRAARLNGDSRRAERRGAPSRHPNAFRVEIHDSGPGIAEEHLEKIFEEYTSYAGGRDRSGGGLGLAICRMIVSAHHGRVWAESNEEGATFCFVLPLWTPAALSTEPADHIAPAAVRHGLRQ